LGILWGSFEGWIFLTRAEIAGLSSAIIPDFCCSSLTSAVAARHNALSSSRRGFDLDFGGGFFSGIIDGRIRQKAKQAQGFDDGRI
jgi:hypothetical protein